MFIAATKSEQYFLDCIEQGRISINADGRIVHKGKILNGCCKNKFHRVSLSANKKYPFDKKVINVAVHRLVWFLNRGDIRPDHYIVPIDGNWMNTKIDNWKEVPKEDHPNRRKGCERSNAAFTYEQVVQYRLDYKEGRISARKIGVKHGCSHVVVLWMLSGKTYQNIPGAVERAEVVKIPRIKVPRKRNYVPRPKKPKVVYIPSEECRVYIMRNFLSKSFREIESEMGISARKTLSILADFRRRDYENERGLIPARKRKEWQNPEKWG